MIARASKEETHLLGKGKGVEQLVDNGVDDRLQDRPANLLVYTRKRRERIMESVP